MFDHISTFRSESQETDERSRRMHVQTGQHTIDNERTDLYHLQPAFRLGPFSKKGTPVE